MVLISFLLGIACIKQPPITIASRPTSISSVLLLESTPNSVFPLELTEHLQAQARRHEIRLNMETLPNDIRWDASTQQRINSISERPILLLESDVEFYSQLNGRFRWDVEAKYTLVDGDKIYEREFSMPIFHQFHHQREAEALMAAEHIFLRELDLLLNEYIQGQ